MRERGEGEKLTEWYGTTYVGTRPETHCSKREEKMGEIGSDFEGSSMVN